MKKVIIIAGIFSAILSACSTSKQVTNNDDVYSNPKEDRLEQARLAAAHKKQVQEEEKKQADQRAAELAAQKAKDDANPAYKDPSYNKDDYYDYQYASRIRRFNNPVNGVGYYDNYYTNSYMYNGNPAMYGSSIYNSYNYWGGSSYGYGGGFPSSYFGMSYGYPSYGYNNFGYNNYGYGGYGCSPYGGYGYNPYAMGYAQGYNNGFYNGYYGYPYGGYGYGGYNNGWGYYNSFDVNSNYSHATNAPRGSHDGGNTGRRTNPSNYNDGLSQKYIQQVQVAQASTPKFNEELRNTRATKTAEYFNNSNPASFENGNTNDVRPGGSYGNSNPKNTINSGNNNDAGFTNYHPGNYNQPKNTINSTNTNEAQFNNPPKTQILNPSYEPDKPVKNTYNNNNNNNPKGNIFESGSPTFNSGNSSPSPSGGGRGGSSGGGGGHRPR